MKELKPTRKLQAIDNNTVYDVSAKLIKLGRDIRKGKWGKVTDCVVAVRKQNEDGSKLTKGFWVGRGSLSEAIVMLERVKQDMIG